MTRDPRTAACRHGAITPVMGQGCVCAVCGARAYFDAAQEADAKELRAGIERLREALESVEHGLAFFIEVRGMPDRAFDFRPVLAKVRAALTPESPEAEETAER